MTAAAAEVLRLEAWRDPDGVLRRALRPTGPRPFGWHSLLDANLSDARDAAAVIARLGGCPIAVHGVRRDGSCTCGRSACQAAGKHPVERDWQKAPLDPERLDAMLRDRWELNLGWRTGPQPGGYSLICLDLDGSRTLLEAFEREHGEFAPTLTAQSARGSHLFFRVPPGRNVGTMRGFLPGVDVRGEGGQVVVSPSAHVSGARYRWIDAREPALLT